MENNSSCRTEQLLEREGGGEKLDKFSTSRCDYQQFCSSELESDDEAKGLEQQRNTEALINVVGREEILPHEGQEGNETDQWINTEKGLRFSSVQVNHPEMHSVTLNGTTGAFQGSVSIPTGEGWMQEDERKPVHYDFFSIQERHELRNPVQTRASNERSSYHRFPRIGSKSSNLTLSMEQGYEFRFERCPNSLGPIQSHFISDLDLSLKLPNSIVAALEVVSDGDNKEEEAFTNDSRVLSPKQIPGMHSRETSRLVYRPCSIAFSTGSGELTETDDCHREGNSLGGLDLFQKKQPQYMEGGAIEDGFGVISSKRWQGRVKDVPSASPVTLTLALPQRLTLHFDPQARQTQSLFWERTYDSSREASQLTPPAAASCVESSECDNFGSTGKLETNLMTDIHERSCYRPEEVDAMSEAEELEKRKEESVTALGINANTQRTPKKALNVNHGALDLLVSAIQVTSGSIAEEDDEELPDCLENGVMSGQFLIQRKRVLRRAKNKFKKLGGEEKRRGDDKLEATGQISDLPSRQRGGKRSLQGQQQEHHFQDGGNEAKRAVLSEVGGMLKDGEPLIRSKRGRCQALPTKFSDSVIQPWKRKSRGRKLET